MNHSTGISLIDCGITSIRSLDIHDLEAASTIILHHNLITRIEGLSKATHLRHLDLSSNSITEIRGLDQLHALRTLNLSSNRIKIVEGLGNLRSLVRLDLSFNAVATLDGLRQLHGSDYSLTVIQLQGNKLDSLDHIACCTRGLVHLRQLTMYDPDIGSNNPVCYSPNYRRMMMRNLPQLEILDNLDSQDRPVQLDVLADIPELSPFLDYVSSSSLSNEANEAERLIQETGIQEALLRTITRPVLNEDPNLGCVPVESHNALRETGESGNNHQQCSLSPLTERRLINLENQLSSLVAMQLMRLNQPLSSQDSFCLNASENSPKPDPGVDGNQLHGVYNNDQLNTMLSMNKELTTNRPKSRTNSSQIVSQRRTPDCIVKPSVSSRRSDDPIGKLQSGQRLQNGSTPKSTPTQVVENRPTRPGADSPDEHPPGAPKRPNRHASCKSPGPAVMHQPNGKPTVPRRPSSTPAATSDATRTNQHPSVGGDLTQSQKNVSRRANTGLKRCDTSEQKTSKPTQGSPTNDVAGRTLGQALKELDAERAQRKETEQRCRDLTEKILRLESSAVNEAKTLEATRKLKQAFTAERRARMAAEAQLRELDVRLSEIFAAVDAMRVREEAEKSRACEETSKMSVRLVELAKDYQDAISRAERAEKKLDEVQCALKTKELEFKELQDTRYAIDSPEVTQLIAARVEAAEARHLQTISSLQEKLDESTNRFLGLEEEFRMALRIEAERYGELFNSAEILKEKVNELDSCNKDLQQREESARQLVTELTSAIKDQKTKATNQQKSNLLIQHNQKERIATLEAHLEEARSRILNVENLKKQEQKQLKAELAAKESLIAGLRSERRNWSEELAQQSSALAQDRGRLEAKIEAQALEISSLKKSLEDDADAIKIKTKIIDDQVDSIRNLKKALAETQAEIKRSQNEALQIHQKLDDQIAQLKKEKDDSADRIQRLLVRKEELKDTIVDLEAKNEDLRSQNEALSQRWHDRTTLLDKLEKQVEQMRSGWEEEQRLLICERDEAKERASSLQVQMERMDASFRDQLAATIEANDRAVSAARTDAEQIRSNCESRVAEVEAEMRAVLEESEQARQTMESRLCKLSSILYDHVPSENSFTGRPRHRGYHSHSCQHRTDWNSTPPAAALSSNNRPCYSRAALTPPPCGHTCVHPASFEPELGSGCNSATCTSPHPNSMQPVL